MHSSGAERGKIGLKDLADRKAVKFESASASERMKQWRAAIGATTQQGTTKAPSRLAYRWLKGFTGWSKSPLGHEQQNDQIPEEPTTTDELEAPHCHGKTAGFRGSARVQRFNGSARLTPLCDQAVVEAEADNWGGLWCENRRYEALDWSGLEDLEPLLPEALRAAAESFPAGTGLGVDHIPPRAIARLSNEALQALCDILMHMERSGDWDNSLRLVLIVLLAKDDGGFRPIGLFPTIIRIWMRARMTQVRAWEAAHHTDELYGGKGMGAQRAAWVEAFRSEAAVLQQEEQAQALLDLTKAFELVDHQKLLDAAKRRGFPLAILRMSLAAYRLPRSIGVDGAFSREVVASRGITAGSGFATSELRLLLLDVLEDTHSTWGQVVKLTLYVDDLTISVRGTAKFVKATLAAAVDQAVTMFQDKLALQVSIAKSTVVASKTRLATAIARRSRARVLKPTAAAKLLGTSCTGGARRSTKVAKARLKKLRACAGRMWLLRKQGANTKLMTRSAGTAAITYGADTQGVSTSLLDQQVSTIARLASPEGGGKNPVKALYVLDGRSGTMDPTFAAHTLPLLHWTTAHWEKWMPEAAMAAAYLHAKGKLEHSKPNWNRAAGPTAALWLTLDRAGWKWINATTFHDDLGDEWCATADPPVAIVGAMARTIRRRRFNAVANMHGGLIPPRPDVGVTYHGKKEFIVEFSSTLSPIACGKVDKLAEAPEFERKHASALLSATAGGQWPQARKASVPRWNIDDKNCQLCHAATGTLEHRRCCPFVKPTGGWAPIPEKAQMAADCIGEDRLRLLRTTGLLAIKLPASPSRQHNTLQWGLQPDGNHHEGVTWYVDGSQMHPRRREMSTLGFGVAAVSSSGDLLAWGWGVPPKWCDSASAAEAWALGTVLQHCAPQDKIITDCMGLLKTAERGLAAATSAKMGLARIWRMVAHTLDGNIAQLATEKKLSWMPAHQPPAAIGVALKSNGRTISAVDWRANHLVDGLAKLAAAEGASTIQEANLIHSAEVLVKHCAGQLAASTFAANNYVEHYTDDKGKPKTRTKRDSVEAPKKMPKKLKDLASLQPKPLASLPEATVGDFSSSEPEEAPSRRSRLLGATLARKKKDSRSKHEAFMAIISAPKRNHREAALDHHRRQQKALSLRTGADTAAAEAWPSFFAIANAAAAGAEGSSLHEPQSCDESPRASSSSTRPSLVVHVPCVRDLTDVPCVHDLTEHCVFVGPSHGGSVQRRERSRPVKGSSKLTAASARAAVDLLVR